MAFFAIVLLRLAIGFHFFNEGTAKLRSGDFASEHFLRAARGPLAPMFHRALEDESGEKRLCVVERKDPEGRLRIEIDTDETFELWRDFVDRIRPYYRFGDVTLLEALVERRQQLADQITEARRLQDRSVDTGELEWLRSEDERSILAIRKQNEKADEILAAHKIELDDWLGQHRAEILQYFNTTDRLDGFQRDGPSWEEVAIQVESLRGQVDLIRADRRKSFVKWTSEVEAIYDSLEMQINGLAVDRQAAKPEYALHRPFDQENSTLKVIDAIIPWFDTLIGVLLIVGLFTRFAAVAGALFLLSVIMSQPPWLPGATDTSSQMIEMFGLIVLAAVCGGRFAGLDYFVFNRKKNRNVPAPTGSENNR